MTDVRKPVDDVLVLADERPPIDAEVRRRVATELDTTFLVEAGAGTGKTRVLVDRYIACLSGADAPPISAVVAITFTEKAAGELRQRIRGRLERILSGDDPVGAALRGAALGLPCRASTTRPISTIHAFAARLLRERPVEAGVDPSFVQLDQVASELLRERLWRDWLSGLLDTDRPAGGNGGRRPRDGRPSRRDPARRRLDRAGRASSPTRGLPSALRSTPASRRRRPTSRPRSRPSGSRRRVWPTPRWSAATTPTA